MSEDNLDPYKDEIEQVLQSFLDDLDKIAPGHADDQGNLLPGHKAAEVNNKLGGITLALNNDRPDIAQQIAERLSNRHPALKDEIEKFYDEAKEQK